MDVFKYDSNDFKLVSETYECDIGNSGKYRKCINEIFDKYVDEILFLNIDYAWLDDCLHLYINTNKFNIEITPLRNYGVVDFELDFVDILCNKKLKNLVILRIQTVLYKDKDVKFKNKILKSIDLDKLLLYLPSTMIKDNIYYDIDFNYYVKSTFIDKDNNLTAEIEDKIEEEYEELPVFDKNFINNIIYPTKCA